MNNKEEDVQFRILSALGIIFVVLGHMNSDVLELCGWLPYYSFHMPLFFFVSGYFYQKPLNVGVFIIKKVKKLLVPFYMAWIIFLIVQTALNKFFDCSLGLSFSLKNLFLIPWTNCQPNGFCVAGWFIITLFSVEIVYLFLDILLSRFAKERIKNICLSVIYLISGIVAFRSRQFTSDELLINLYKVMATISFFHFGYIFKSYIQKYVKDISPILYFGAIFAGLCFIKYKWGIARVGLYALVDIENGFIVTFVTAVLGIAFWYRIAQYVLLLNKVKLFLLYIWKKYFSDYDKSFIHCFLNSGGHWKNK